MNIKKSLWIRIRRLIKNWAVPVGCGLFFLFLMKCVFFVGYVPTASMEPAVREGALIFGVRTCGELERGDIVVFEHEERLLVKRVAAVPGDTVEIGSEILIIPDGHYFMLGDNAEESIDSRYWDEPFVERGVIIAKLINP